MGGNNRVAVRNYNMPSKQFSLKEFPKKICFVSLNAYPVLTRSGIRFAGGAELQESLLARELTTRGADVSFITLDLEDGMETHVDGIRIIPSFKPKEGIPIFRFLHPRYTSIWKALKNADADIYYQRTASVLTAYVSRFARIHGKKSIHAISHDREVGGDLRFLNIRDRMLYKYGLKNVDHIIVQSKSQRENLRKNFNRDGIFLSNGIKIPGFIPEFKREGSVIWVATLRPWKRPELFLELAESLPDIPFLMAGGPDPKFPYIFEECRRRAESIPNLDFCGYVPVQEIGRLFNEAVLFVNTSEREGFPNTYLQAWVHGMPVISLGVDPDGIISRKRLGAICGSFRDLQTYIRLYFRNDNLREHAGQRAWNHVKEHHDIRMLTEKFISHFEPIKQITTTDSLIVDSKELMN